MLYGGYIYRECTQGLCHMHGDSALFFWALSLGEVVLTNAYVGSLDQIWGIVFLLVPANTVNSANFGTWYDTSGSHPYVHCNCLLQRQFGATPKLIGPSSSSTPQSSRFSSDKVQVLVFAGTHTAKGTSNDCSKATSIKFMRPLQNKYVGMKSRSCRIQSRRKEMCQAISVLPYCV